MEHRAVRQHRDGHRLADLRDALGERHLLEVGGVEVMGRGRPGDGEEAGRGSEKTKISFFRTEKTCPVMSCAASEQRNAASG